MSTGLVGRGACREAREDREGEQGRLEVRQRRQSDVDRALGRAGLTSPTPSTVGASLFSATSCGLLELLDAGCGTVDTKTHIIQLILQCVCIAVSGEMTLEAAGASLH